MRDEEIHDRYKSIRSGTDMNLLGIGASAYSHNHEYIFRNNYFGKGGAGIKKYISHINQSGFAIKSGYRLSEYEISASRMVKGIRYGVNYLHLTSKKYKKEITPILDRLITEEMIRHEVGFLVISEEGRIFEEEICRLLYSEEIKEILNFKQ